jgi:purine-nucleoside phosphorylase
MDVILNLGNPAKEVSSILNVLLPSCSKRVLKLTGAQVFLGPNIAVTSAVYGAGMTLDCLEEMKLEGTFQAGDSLMLVGSMGSLCEEIQLGDIVVPECCVCAYYGFKGIELFPHGELLRLLRASLEKEGKRPIAYRHGSSFAVFDPHTNHSTYKSTLYDASVRGVDCGETFVGLEFARRNQLSAAAVLYCSDSPRSRISDIGVEEFERRATAFDILLNKVAADVVRT